MDNANQKLATSPELLYDYVRADSLNICNPDSYTELFKGSYSVFLSWIRALLSRVAPSTNLAFGVQPHQLRPISLSQILAPS
ncbi:hypothetical protein VCR4J2_250719 [Vibrio coralliirubri]|nr:hypothetical protein VCR4J2_250719 [Vibrio coralliirubri]